MTLLGTERTGELTERHGVIFALIDNNGRISLEVRKEPGSFLDLL